VQTTLPAASPPTRPRYFWRRLLAYGVDGALAWVVAGLLLAAFVTDDFSESLLGTLQNTDFGISVSFQTESFRPPISLYAKSCGVPVGAAKGSLVEYVAPATIKTAEICIWREYGIPSELAANVVLDDTPAAGDLAGKTIEVPFTITNAYRLSDVIAFGIFFAISVTSLWSTGTTPGKWLLGLRIKGAARIPALRRETIRTLPLVLCVAVISAMNELLRVQPDIYQTLYIPGLVVSITGISCGVALWVLPMLRWRGAMPYDKWLGLHVARKVPSAS
jgi:uncharacterized RDD family membrane protein YckC